MSRPSVDNLISAARSLSQTEQMALLAGLGADARALKTGGTKMSITFKPRRCNRAVRRVKRMRRDYFPEVPNNQSST